MPFVTIGAVTGFNVRVGLENSLFIGRGRLAESNAEQVGKCWRKLDGLGLEEASPDEAHANASSHCMNNPSRTRYLHASSGDTDSCETEEWRDAFLAVVASEGPKRARSISASSAAGAG